MRGFESLLLRHKIKISDSLSRDCYLIFLSFHSKIRIIIGKVCYDMKDFTLEVCVDSVESATAAVQGGATRLELCANLVIGGTTPSIFLFREIRKLCPVPINVIIRPRFGDFCYSSSELKIMIAEITQYLNEGADGVVFGALLPDGGLDQAAMKPLCRAADKMSITLHKAFDMSKDPYAVFKQAEALGISTILTSGQRKNVLDGVDLIKELALSGKIDIMVGGGVNASIIPELRAKTGISSFHLSGKVLFNSPMVYRNPEMSMGISEFGEYDIFRTSSELVAAARKVLEEIA